MDGVQGVDERGGRVQQAIGHRRSFGGARRAPQMASIEGRDEFASAVEYRLLDRDAHLEHRLGTGPVQTIEVEVASAEAVLPELR